MQSVATSALTFECFAQSVATSALTFGCFAQSVATSALTLSETHLRYITLVTVLRNIGMPAAVNYAQPEQIAYKFLLNGETETGSLTYQQLDVQRKAFYVPDSKEPNP
ncbi:MAG: hypothetical protein HWQ38_08820 [Nostoc sp. NMS7]|uniref:hypothetical protein n=1 Tax=uncultured Nostoc sp. TaxID=340711 RepID=UPI0035CBD809|nr:hypothetical protein [Nostoc sp. NMS7]